MLLEKTKENPSYTDEVNSNAVDDHSKWDNNETTQDSNTAQVQKETAKQMIKKAGELVISSKIGNLPQNYSQLLGNLTLKKEINWKQQLRKIIGNKPADKRKTLTKRNRRQPHMGHIKGIRKK